MTKRESIKAIAADIEKLNRKIEPMVAKHKDYSKEGEEHRLLLKAFFAMTGRKGVTL